MTVFNITNFIRANGDGADVTFDFSFPVKTENDVVVKKILNSTGVATTLTITTDYTVALNTVTEGGTITYVVAPSALEDSFIKRALTQDQQTALPIGGNFPEVSVENEIDRSRMIDIELQEQIGRCIIISETETLTSINAPIGTSASNRATKVWAWNDDGDGLVLGTGIGSFTGDWAASRAYLQRDLIKDTSNNNIYYCKTAHTSSGAEPISTNADVAKWDLIVDSASATTSASNASTSETNAATSETNAATSETNAATSETNAATSETNTAADAVNTAADAVNTAADAVNTAADRTIVENAANMEGTAVVSTGEAGGIKFLREDGDNTSSWQEVPGGTSPGLYAREQDDKWIIKGLSTAADRFTIKSPIKLHVEVNGELHEITSATEFDLSASATWDTTGGTDYTVAANRIGTDFYIYVVDNSGTTSIEFSANPTVPDGHSAATSRKIGGFHCLCVDVGTISGHSLTNFVAGDVLPATIWDYDNRPISATEGMFLAKSGRWTDIYLPSVSGGELVSRYLGTIADGVSTEKFHTYKFEQWFARIGKKPITQVEFVDASIGSNQGTNISGSADPGSTGGHSDTAGRRIISNGGGEDMCGAYWQWGRDTGGLTGGATSRVAFDAEDSDVAGQHFEEPFRPLLGGGWSAGVQCGSRGSDWNTSPLGLTLGFSSRGVAEPKN